MHSFASSFSYSKLESYSEGTDSSEEKGSSWLTRSCKFLLRSAPPADSFSGRRRQRCDISYADAPKFGLHSCTPAEAKLRSKSAMESPTAENATETQIELRTEGFQATLLWERIVSHLEKNVKCGRHSYALRSYDNCFPGHKAVDCLTAYMNSVLPKSVKKSQARLLGQKLLLTRVIEDARKKEKTVFRESRLYRFTGIHFWDPPRDMHGSFTGAEVSCILGCIPPKFCIAGGFPYSNIKGY